MNSQENMLKHKHTNAFLNNYETNSKKVDNINNFLEKETTNSKSESWNKMDKTGKIKLLNEYVDSIIEKHNLELTDITELKKYLIDSLDKKKLQHVKDVHCDKTTGKILSIPTLNFNSTTRKFTLKRCEKRVSTLKSLGKGKKSPSNSKQAPLILSASNGPE
jgi:hypothetical protein